VNRLTPLFHADLSAILKQRWKVQRNSRWKMVAWHDRIESFSMILPLNDLQKRFLYFFLNLNAFVITDTELKLMAAAAMTGPSRMPKKGYNTPAATGTPTEL